MRRLNDPRQTQLFDVFADILSPVAYRKLQSGWQHLFRQAILKLMPARQLAEHFHPVMGRPTKELYSMAGLLFVMEFRDWTHEEAADAYMFNVDLQYALNMVPEQQSLCRRTIERYIKLFRDDELAGDIMETVTAELVRLLDLDVSQQRLRGSFAGVSLGFRFWVGYDLVFKSSLPNQVTRWHANQGFNSPMRSTMLSLVATGGASCFMIRGTIGD